MTQNTFKNFWTKRGHLETLDLLKQQPDLWTRYRALESNKMWQQRLLDFLSGEKIMPILYDAFFKRLFHPDIHPDRLAKLLGCILGKNVKVLRVLSNEDVLIDGGALVIMDIVVELEDHSIANVEVQKVPYLFPVERMSCYSADLLIRQYSRVKGELGSSFTYGDLKKVYTIVFFEKTTKTFKDKELHNHYIHIGKTTFDTGLKLELLQEYFLVALDVFQKNIYPKNTNNIIGNDSEQTAWLSLLTTETMEDATRLIQSYPWMEDIFRDMAEYLHKPKEVLEMFSDALRQLDKNTELYMIEELERDNKNLQEKVDCVQQENNSLSRENSSLHSELHSAQQENILLVQKIEELQKQLAP